jgi:hypothetical protein
MNGDGAPVPNEKNRPIARTQPGGNTLFGRGVKKGLGKAPGQGAVHQNVVRSDTV